MSIVRRRPDGCVEECEFFCGLHLAKPDGLSCGKDVTLVYTFGQPRIRVKGHKANSYVSISLLERGSLSGGSVVKTFGLRDFPSAEEFAAYDRIAGRVKSMQVSKNTSPLNV